MRRLSDSNSDSGSDIDLNNNETGKRKLDVNEISTNEINMPLSDEESEEEVVPEIVTVLLDRELSEDEENIPKI